jgi:hypothetical protein
MTCRIVTDCDSLGSDEAGNCYETQFECECACGIRDPDSFECICLLQCPEGTFANFECRCICEDTSECGGGRVRDQSDCECKCPADTEWNGLECVPLRYTCVNGECVGGQEGPYSSLVACVNRCVPQTSGGDESGGTGRCIPELPPPATPLFCPDGSQGGIILYWFDYMVCSWQSITLIWSQCGGGGYPQPPDPPSSSSGGGGGGGGSSSSSDDCGGENTPPPAEYTTICGRVVATKLSGSVPGTCFSYYTDIEYCDECDPETGLPVIKSSTTHQWEQETGAFEPVIPESSGVVTELPCPGESSSGGSSLGSSRGSSSGSSSASSSGSSSASSSGSSSASSSGPSSSSNGGNPLP